MYLAPNDSQMPSTDTFRLSLSWNVIGIKGLGIMNLAERDSTYLFCGLENTMLSFVGLQKSYSKMSNSNICSIFLKRSVRVTCSLRSDLTRCPRDFPQGKEEFSSALALLHA